MLFIRALNLVETVAPTVEPITTAEAKTHLRIDTSAEDTYIDTLIEAARQYVEAWTGRVLVERTYRADVREWAQVVVLPRPQLISVTQIQYYDADNSQQTWAATNYEVDAAGSRVLLADGKTIPVSYDRYDAWQCTFQAGYQRTGSPEDFRAAIPEGIKSAIKLVIGDLYENRESSTPLKLQDLPTVQRILAQYRAR